MNGSRISARRWLLGGVTAAVAAGSLAWAASAGAVDSEPTPADVLNALQQPSQQALTGTVVTKVDLGLPNAPVDLLDLPAPLDPESDEVMVRVWVDGPDRQRVTVLTDPADETPIPVQDTALSAVRDGDTAWVWSAEDATATAYALNGLRAGGTTPMPPGRQTPAEVTEQILEYLDGNTDVTVAESEPVAGRDTIALVLTPQDPNTLISQITVAVDSDTNVPLSVRVGSSRLATPAIETTFTSLEYGTPDPGVFEFSPPEGATVVEKDGVPTADSKGEKPTVVGEGWSAVAVGSFSLPDLAAGGAMDRLGEDQGETAVALISTYLSLPKIGGEWGSGRLLEGNLFSVILTEDGRYAIGAVDGDALESALGE
jgi:outer membrane lipoprotein-sorting protein